MPAHAGSLRPLRSLAVVDSTVAAAKASFAEEFAAGVLTFGRLAVRRYVKNVLSGRRAGQHIEEFDALIAANGSMAVLPLRPAIPAELLVASR
jgi:hypothetical protein